MNAFELLGMPARPCIDQEKLKNRLRELSKKYQDDESGQLQQVNQAYQLLRQDVSRIGHLLELSGQTGLAESSAVPEEVMSLFSEIGPALQQADTIIARIDTAESVLEKAMLQDEVMTQSVLLQNKAAEVGQFKARLVAAISVLDEKWTEERDVEKLAAIYRQLVYVARWARQLDEKQFRLMNFQVSGS